MSKFMHTFFEYATGPIRDNPLFSSINKNSKTSSKALPLLTYFYHHGLVFVTMLIKAGSVATAQAQPEQFDSARFFWLVIGLDQPGQLIYPYPEGFQESLWLFRC